MGQAQVGGDGRSRPEEMGQRGGGAHMQPTRGGSACARTHMRARMPVRPWRRAAAALAGGEARRRPGLREQADPVGRRRIRATAMVGGAPGGAALRRRLRGWRRFLERGRESEPVRESEGEGRRRRGGRRWPGRAARVLRRGCSPAGGGSGCRRRADRARPSPPTRG